MTALPPNVIKATWILSRLDSTLETKYLVGSSQGLVPSPLLDQIKSIKDDIFRNLERSDKVLSKFNTEEVIAREAERVRSSQQSMGSQIKGGG